jgi:ribonuclease HII
MLEQQIENHQDETIAYIDEAGRGPLSGPVTAAVVIWDQHYEPKTENDKKLLELIKDSKKLSAKQREKLETFIKENATEYAICSIDHEEIDRINILQATFKAMHGAIDQLKTSIDLIYVDGDKFKPYMDKQGNFIPHTCVKGGDNMYLGIAAASILAKTCRDKWIVDLHNANEDLQVYAWNSNKGYGTKAHMDAIRRHGMSPYHRRSFIHL